MKKTVSFLCLIILAFNLLSCGQSNIDADSKTLPFPGTAWGMTPDELIDALKLKKSEYSVIPAERDDDLYIITVEQAKVFNADADIAFHFEDTNNDGTFHLFGLKAGLANNTDFDSLVAAFTKQYGEPEMDIALCWNSKASKYDLMSEKDKAVVDTMESFAQSAYHEPATIIQLYINGVRYEASYQGEGTNDYIYWISTVRFTHEGGFTDQ